MFLRRAGLVVAAALAVLGAAPVLAQAADPVAAAAGQPASAGLGMGGTHLFAPPVAVTNDSHYRRPDGCLHPTPTVAVTGPTIAWFDSCEACLKARTMAYQRGTDEYDCVFLNTDTVQRPSGYNLIAFGPRYGTPHPIAPW